MKNKIQSRIRKVSMIIAAACFMVTACGNSNKDTQTDVSLSKNNILEENSAGNTDTGKKELPTEYMEASYEIDIDNEREVVGAAHYVFAAYVESMEGTEYKNPVETSSGTYTTPYTNYKVRVLKNIKGKLDTTKEILIQKCGGISEDGNCNIVYEEDELPEAGKAYVFCSYVQPDGTLLVTGANSNTDVELEEQEVEEIEENFNEAEEVIKNNDTCIRYEEAYEEQIETDAVPKTAESKYDVS